MSHYFVVNVENLSHSEEDWISQRAFECGALGISEALAFEQPPGEEDYSTRIPDRRNIDIYFQSEPEEAFVRELRERFSVATVKVRREPVKDWLEEWKKGFVPFELAGGHWVVPSWCEAPVAATHKIWIDPGMAFGTGTHDTTQLVAKALAGATVPSSLLDVGTGTGILAIMAKQLGVARVVTTEIEEDSRRVAKENFVRNGVPEIKLDERQVEDLTDKFDVVVANIIDGILVRIQEALKARVRPGGWLILSGIITEREKDFLEGFNLPDGKTWEKRVQQGDWLLYATRL